MIKYEALSEKYLLSLTELDRACFKVSWSYSLFEQELLNDNSYYILAISNETVIGYCGVNTVLDEGNITNLAVRSDFRKKGIGENLINRIILYCIEKEISILNLEVRESNHIALNLYDKIGFSIVGKRKNYYSDNRETAILMTKKI